MTTHATPAVRSNTPSRSRLKKGSPSHKTLVTATAAHAPREHRGLPPAILTQAQTQAERRQRPRAGRVLCRHVSRV